MRAPRRAATTETLTRQECEELARRVLEMVGGSQAQVKVGSGTSSSVSFARGDTHMARENVSISVRLEVEVGDRHASGMTNQLDEASLRELVVEVEALAREKRTPGEWTDESVPPIPPPQEYAEGPQIFFGTVDARVAAMIRQVSRRGMF